MSLRGLAAISAFLLTTMAASLAAAQTPEDLGRAPVEDLMRVEVQRVFGASERLQPVTEAPSSVTIVTADDIARFGYRTLADVLRSVRGFYATNDRNYSYVGVRGFGRPGDYNTRVLLLVNGHKLNDNVYDQAAVGAEFGLDAAMFERVEIIRGPASSLYGTSAFFAVINVVTRTGASLNGTSVDVEGGSLGTALVRAAFGRRFENGRDLAISGTVERSDGVKQLYFPAFDSPSTNNGIAQDLDGEHLRQVYGRISFRDVTITTAFGGRVKNVPTASFFTQFDMHDPAEQTRDQRGTVGAQYDHLFGQTRVTLDTAFDRFYYDGTYPFESEDPNESSLVLRDAFLGMRWGASGRATRPLAGGQTLTLGAEYYDNFEQRQWETYNGGSEPAFDLRQSSGQTGFFAQDEIKVRPWLILNGGLRHDRYADFSRTTPRAAVILLPSANESIKYLYGRAFRAPNAYELYYYEDATATLRPESIGTHEVVWEAYFGEHLRASTSAYHYSASQLITLAVKGDEFNFINDGVIDADGLELEGELRLKNGLRAVGSYALQKAHTAGESDALTNSPLHNAKARIGVPARLRGSFAALEWQYLSARRTLAGTAVDPMSIVHATFTAPFGRALTLTAAVRNLFDSRYSDPASDEHPYDAIQQNGRSVRVGIRWSMGAGQ